MGGVLARFSDGGGEVAGLAPDIVGVRERADGHNAREIADLFVVEDQALVGDVVTDGKWRSVASVRCAGEIQRRRKLCDLFLTAIVAERQGQRGVGR